MMKEDALYLRDVETSDVDYLFEWVNDVATRQNAFDTHSISYSEHVEWFNNMLKDDNQVQYILMRGNEPIGQSRLSIKGADAEIDYSISAHSRGYGYGKELIRLTIERVKIDHHNVTRLIGRVKPSNEASYYCFMGNGFEDKYRQLEYNLMMIRD